MRLIERIGRIAANPCPQVTLLTCAPNRFQFNRDY